MRIKRHNEAVKLIAQAVGLGENGGCILVMDACKASDLKDVETGTRIPQWVLPKSAKQDLDKCTQTSCSWRG